MPASLPARVRASLAYDAGLYAGALGDLAFACACYEAHNEIAGALADPAPIATGLRTLAYTERLRGDLTGARRLLERSAEIAGGAAAAPVRAAAHADQVHAVRALALLAAVLHDLGEVDAAGERFARLRALGDAPVARRALWEAEHALALGRRDEAREATERNLAECRRRGWEGHVAHGHTLLGLALLDGRRRRRRRRFLGRRRRVGRGAPRRGAPLGSATGEVEVALRCHELAARIALAAGRLDDGARQALEGLHVAEACGFGPFRARLAVVAARCALARGAGRRRLRWRSPTRRCVGGRGRVGEGGRAALGGRGGRRARGGRARGRELLAEAAALRARLRHPGAAASREALRG